MRRVVICVALMAIACSATKHDDDSDSTFNKIFKRGIFGFGGAATKQPPQGVQGGFPSTIAVKYPSGQSPPGYASVMQGLSPYGAAGQSTKGSYFASSQGGLGGITAQGPALSFGGSSAGFGQFGSASTQYGQTFGQQSYPSYGQQQQASYSQQTSQPYGGQQFGGQQYGGQQFGSQQFGGQSFGGQQYGGQQYGGQQFGGQQFSSSPLKVSSFGQQSQFPSSSSNPYSSGHHRPYSSSQSNQGNSQTRPYRITIPQPVQVNKPYPVQVLRPVAVNVPYPVHVLKPYRVEVPHPIPVQVPQPFNVQVPVPVPQNVPVNQQQYDGGQGYGNDYGHQQQQQQQQQQGYGQQQSGYGGDSVDYGANSAYGDFNNNQDTGKWQAVSTGVAQEQGGYGDQGNQGQQYGGNYGGGQQEYGNGFGYTRRSDHDGKSLKLEAKVQKKS